MTDTNTKAGFSPFAPLLALSASILVFMTWTLGAAVQQRLAGLRIKDQQERQLAQAGEVEDKLRQMMADLVSLSATNANALAIVKKYGITFSAAAPPGAPAAPPASQPAP